MCIIFQVNIGGWYIATHQQNIKYKGDQDYVKHNRNKRSINEGTGTGV